MLCKQCGKEIKEGSGRCENCGAVLSKKTLGATEIFLTVISIIFTILGVVTFNGYMFGWGLLSVFMGALCKRISYEKGLDDAFGIGWLFLLFGLIIVLVIPSKKAPVNIQVNNNTDKYDQVKKLKGLLDSGAITEEEFKSEKEKLFK